MERLHARREMMESDHGGQADDEAQGDHPAAPMDQPTTRSGRTIRMPRRNEDYIPTATRGLMFYGTLPRQEASAATGEQLNNSGPSALQASTIASSSLEPIITAPNQFSVFRQYDHPPRGPDPEEESMVQDQCETTEHNYGPYINESVFLMMHWAKGLNRQLSETDLQNLIDNVLFAENFRLEKLHGVSVRQVHRAVRLQMVKLLPQVDIAIRLPCAQKKWKEESCVTPITIPQVSLRKASEVIREIVQDSAQTHFHWQPFRKYVRGSDGTNTRILDEVYNSDVFIDDYNELQSMPRNPDDCSDLPYAILSVNFYSDATLLANFGNDVAWPIYMSFGNQSKKIRRQLNMLAQHHVGYFPKIDTYALGSRRDTNNRTRKARIDDEEYVRLVKKSRKNMFENGDAVGGAYVKGILKPFSSKPILSPFTEKFRQFGIKRNAFALFPNDIMHELNLGVAKNLVTYAIEMAQFYGHTSKVDRRFAQIASFGRNDIRAFPQQASGLKKLTAHDWECLLKCLIPVIEGLLNPSIEKIIIPLILKLSIVYNLAYLDQQTERTIRLLDREIGEFSRLALSLSKQAHSLSDSTRLTSPDKNIPMYAYATPKFHMLGHLTASIRRLGPLDNFTTAFGESEHRRLKRLYNVTNKTRSGTQQLGLRVQEQRAIVQQHRMIHAMSNVQEDLQRDNLGDPSYEQAFQLAMDKRQPEYIGDLMERALSFPELKCFGNILLSHVVRRLFPEHATSDDITAGQRDMISIIDDKIFWHNALRLFHTKYNMERTYDVINPNLKPIDVMLQGPADENQPFLFARVMRIFHVDIYKKCKAGLVTMNDVEKHSLPVIWLKWMEGPDAYGFIDPTCVLQACHLIPCFKDGMYQSEDGLQSWKSFYLSAYVNPDIMMRFLGGGVGHQQKGRENETLSTVVQTNNQNSGTGTDDMMNVNAGAGHNESDYRSDEDDSELMEEEDDPVDQEMRELWLRMEED
ncbi:hypothetical protein LQV05_006411 [Cryptococcus neoformans]|nr:hypothetical protein LQV05_006411 [Cryptococcus neoformans]